MKEELTDEKLRALVVSHAINLGKCPPAGTLLTFTAEARTFDPDSMHLKRVIDPARYGFVVKEEDIVRARQLITKEQVSYVPKITVH